MNTLKDITIVLIVAALALLIFWLLQTHGVLTHPCDNLLGIIEMCQEGYIG